MPNGDGGWGSWKWHGDRGEGRYWADTGDGRGYMRHRVTYHGNKRGFERLKAELRAKYDTGRNAHRVPTFQELWESDVLPTVEKLSENARHSYTSAWRAHVGPRWGSVRLDAYNGAQVQEWLGGIPERTGRACLTVMRKVSNRAYLLGLVQNDPLAAKISTSGVSSRPDEATSLELGPYLEVALGECPQVLSVFLLTACGGCRVGEAMAVRADSVEWDDEGDRATFIVDDQASQWRRGTAGRLKTRQSARVAAVSGAYGRMLVELAAAAIDRGETYMCDDGMGSTVSEASLRNKWKRALDRAGLEQITLRSMRRSFATLSLNAGADFGDLNIIMGRIRNSPVLFSNYDKPDRSKAPKIASFGTFGDKS